MEYMTPEQAVSSNIEETFKQLILKDQKPYVTINRDILSDTYQVAVTFTYHVKNIDIRQKGIHQAFLNETIKYIENLSNNIKDLEK